MEERLEHELHIGATPQRTCGAASVAAHAEEITDTLLDMSGDDGASLPPAVSALIKRCLDRTEPIDGLKSNDRVEFTPRHVNMVMLRAAGFKANEIGQALGITTSTVCRFMRHPYAQKILHALISARGARVLDIRSKLDNYADEVLDRMFDLAQKSDDLDAVSKVGFGLLDRAGYGPQSKVTHDVKTSPVATESTLSRLAHAMEQSLSVDRSIMPTYKPQRPPDEGLELEGSSSDDVLGSDSSGSEAGLSSGGVRLTKVASA